MIEGQWKKSTAELKQQKKKKVVTKFAHFWSKISFPFPLLYIFKAIYSSRSYLQCS